ncbi:periplasmic heavy metal sensor [Trinickia soli]|uniref:Periplasmic heavy metal sensor n=1 Tax=Trinickia soli TaxID=380675 RepID=A0A2N7WCR5_9BURK|nr:periplasmic heavy metal sensor [Trinickia soli]KAA0083084.1 periplasmic heavy metal sensor [Paraburkholderia sp. T12-10]PMS27206.1 hypothetical protein C0Z19_05535 [Trinickia soli]CAB3638567.1 hypothetical protein LMG24076_00083 [Trinickia soli]
MTTRAIKALCIGSLALNIFLLGAIAGGAYRWFSARHDSPAAVAAAGAPPALRYAAQALSPERQRQFQDALRQARREARPLAQQAREGRREVLRLVAAPQFDRSALDTALENTRAADRRVRERVEAAVAAFVQTLTPAERATFAQGLRLRGQWREPLAKRPREPSQTSDANGQ